MQKIIVFDIDGTLTKTEQLHNECYFDALKQCFDIEIPNDFDWTTIKNITDGGVMEEVFYRLKGKKPSQDDYMTMRNEFNQKFEQNFSKDDAVEIPGAKKFIDQVKGKNFKLGIATGSWEIPAILKLNAIGVDYQDFPFSNGNYYNTREEITLDVLHKINSNFRPEDVYYFGDGIWDFKTCKNLGINFIGIDNNEDEKLKNAGAEYVFKDFSDSKRILEIIN